MLKVIKEHLFFLKVWYLQVFKYPRENIEDELDYERYAANRHDVYWKMRKEKTKHGLNSVQVERVSLIANILSKEVSVSILDIGCGEGGTFIFLKEKISITKAIGIDDSTQALAIAAESGVETRHLDITKPEVLKKLPTVDVTLLLEVLEHLPEPEVLLRAVYKQTNKHIFFSFPNSGYFLFRLRLLFGKFPMQWRIHPGEHLRFWTDTDLKWWLTALGYKNYKIFYYSGIPVLNKVWPSMFATGFVVFIEK